MDTTQFHGVLLKQLTDLSNRQEKVVEKLEGKIDTLDHKVEQKAGTVAKAWSATISVLVAIAAWFARG